MYHRLILISCPVSTSQGPGLQGYTKNLCIFTILSKQDDQDLPQTFPAIDKWLLNSKRGLTAIPELTYK